VLLVVPTVLLVVPTVLLVVPIVLLVVPIVVLVGGQGFGLQAPEPTLMPLSPSHAAALSTTHWVNAPPGEVTQHWMSPPIVVDVVVEMIVLDVVPMVLDVVATVLDVEPMIVEVVDPGAHWPLVQQLQSSLHSFVHAGHGNTW